MDVGLWGDSVWGLAEGVGRIRVRADDQGCQLQ